MIPEAALDFAPVLELARTCSNPQLSRNPFYTFIYNRYCLSIPIVNKSQTPRQQVAFLGILYA